MWEPRLHRATSAHYDRFAFCLAELEYDDPFSAVIEYNSAFAQPWSRTDISREIISLCYWPRNDLSEPLLMGLSNEGDVYALSGPERPAQKIPGAGLDSPDADGRGQVWSICGTEKAIYVVGENAQIYRSEDGVSFVNIQNNLEELLEQTEGVSKSYSKSIGLPEDQVIFLNVQRDAQANAPVQVELRDNMSVDEAIAAMQQSLSKQTSSAPIETVLLLSQGEPVVLYREEKTGVKSIFVDGAGKLWVIGISGLILTGPSEGPLEKVGFVGDTETLLSGTEFQNEIYFASDYMLHKFDGHRLLPVKPKIDPTINNGVPTPVALAGYPEGMLYFDYKHGVCKWDGTNWDWLEIPSELLQRNFKGLR